jgi:hypothetical protein
MPLLAPAISVASTRCHPCWSGVVDLAYVKVVESKPCCTPAQAGGRIFPLRGEHSANRKPPSSAVRTPRQIRVRGAPRATYRPLWIRLIPSPAILLVGSRRRPPIRARPCARRTFPRTFQNLRVLPGSRGSPGSREPAYRKGLRLGIASYGCRVEQRLAARALQCRQTRTVSPGPFASGLPPASSAKLPRMRSFDRQAVTARFRALSRRSSSREERVRERSADRSSHCPCSGSEVAQVDQASR